MRTLMTIFMAGALALGACGDDDDMNNNNQTQPDAATQDDAAVQDDAAQQDDAATTSELGVGSACECTGQGCDNMSVPVPNGGTIVGCDDVPTQTGAELVCMQTYSGGLATDTWFANGFCSLMATTCTGAALICDSAVFGDYDTMVACPAGMVMIEDTQEVDVFNNQATIQNKLCAPSCTTSADCREGEEDPKLYDEVTQYQCVDKGGVKFCYDPRNLGTTYTVTQF